MSRWHSLEETFWRLAAGSRAGQARGFLRVWPWWERFEHWRSQAQLIPGSHHRAFLVQFERHKGDPVVLRDGTVVRAGDGVAMVHVDNKVLVEAVAENIWDLLPVLKGDLRALAAWVQQPDFPHDVQALSSVTLIGAGAKLLGFSTRERPVTIRARLERFYMQGLLTLYSRDGLGRLQLGGTRYSYPVEIWMSRAELLRRYGAAAPQQNHSRG